MKDVDLVITLFSTGTEYAVLGIGIYEHDTNILIKEWPATSIPKGGTLTMTGIAQAPPEHELWHAEGI